MELVRLASPRSGPTERRCDCDCDGSAAEQALRCLVAMTLIKSKKRVADHGEVFTPAWLVERMLDLVKGESERIDSRFLEPACGSGNFLVRILQHKLDTVELKYGRSAFEKRIYGLVAVASCYGIELLDDNIAECHANMLALFSDCMSVTPEDEVWHAASNILSLNLIHGDALSMLAADGGPITFVEWGYVGNGKFQRRDFRLDRMTQTAGLREEGMLFQHLGKHEVFQPVKTWPPMTQRDLAALDKAPEGAAA